MKALLSCQKHLKFDAHIEITGSKSESNRLLILQALYPNLKIDNLSNSDDTAVLSEGLKIDMGIVDIHHAGTAMRFLTAYFASQKGKIVTITGSNRMQKRPITVLVRALRELGAHIEYVKEEGFPPLKIIGKELTNDVVTVETGISSQYISALMLIAPSLRKGLTIHLEGKVTSSPYIGMTMSLLKSIGITCSFSENRIVIDPSEKIEELTLTVESDWSSASYFYSIVALSDAATVTLRKYKKESLQGDAALEVIYEKLGVTTHFDPLEETLILSNSDKKNIVTMTIDLIHTPDLAQTIAVSCFGLGKGCFLSGLHTLKIKETDRLLALKIELEKLGAQVSITEDSLQLYPSEPISEKIEINTHNDHRMAMAFAPLALKVPITINDCDVVTKSFPSYWEDLKKVGFDIDFR
ncbi:MAG: 3-phosphoshikimate 1-carboxyvinyltransferase [Bacteroidetes bacterium]|nr:3-phosphoshikimate 1-carboxyvinyltransferase [Bacteroidota bacterium]